MTIRSMVVRLAKRAPGSRKPPLLLAGALVRDESGRFLLIHRNIPGMTWWEVPGGKIEAGEDPWTAAQRELAEELGVAVEQVAEVGTEQFVCDTRQLVYTWFVASVAAGDPSVLEEERFDEVRYFTWDEAQKLESVSPSVRCLFERRAERLLASLSCAEDDEVVGGSHR